MKSGKRNRLFEILELRKAGDLAARIFDTFIIALILLNVIAVVLQTIDSLYDQHARFFNIFEAFSIAVFTIEYIIRLWVCTSDNRFKSPLSGRFRYALTPLALVDLMAFLPFYLPAVIPYDLRFVRVVRLIRLFRLFKLDRYTGALRFIANVLKSKKEELLITFCAVMILLVLASGFMYFIEQDAQPESFSSIPAAMWWGINTLTTVGYGDVYPLTPAGRFFGAIVSILGIVMFALPAGILASGFTEEFQRRRLKASVCPHCGKDIGEPGG